MAYTTIDKNIYDLTIDLNNKHSSECKPIGNYMVKNMNNRVRETLVDWLYELKISWNLKPETLILSVYILDSYLSHIRNIKLTELQLIGCTSLLIAEKYEEIYCHDISYYVKVSCDAFTVKNMIECEKHIFNTLNYCVSIPTIWHFAHIFSKFAFNSEYDSDLLEWILICSLLSQKSLLYNQSTIAAASVLLMPLVVSKKTKEELLNFFNLISSTHQDILKCSEELKKYISNNNTTYSKTNRVKVVFENRKTQQCSNCTQYEFKSYICKRCSIKTCINCFIKCSLCYERYCMYCISTHMNSNHTRLL